MSVEIKVLDETWNWEIGLQNFLEEGNSPILWNEFFNEPKIKEELKTISKRISETSSNREVFPPIHKVFRTFNLPPKKIRVVILGQDPYHNPGSAVGLCFSVPSSKQINPSLQNIYKELENEGFKPEKDGNLEKWLNQGCFLLNTALTVESGMPESHLPIWYNFSSKLIKYISSETENVAWILMGAKALTYSKFIDQEKRGHKLFVTSHPSPLSAYKGFQKYPAFVGSNVFKNVNDFLKTPIEW